MSTRSELLLATDPCDRRETDDGRTFFIVLDVLMAVMIVLVLLSLGMLIGIPLLAN